VEISAKRCQGNHLSSKADEPDVSQSEFRNRLGPAPGKSLGLQAAFFAGGVKIPSTMEDCH
jgi:hypothetical protein